MSQFTIRGNIVDLHHQEIFAGEITVVGSMISNITQTSAKIDASLPYILPGFIDSHVHIESSMLIPSEFARLAVVHGTVATISDPHEIANVCGIEGVQYMIDNGNKVNFKFYFGAPSCVPATRFETAGDEINADGVKTLLTKKEVRYLSEMMNFPGVIHDDPEVMKKISAAHQLSKPIDGHAPGLRGEPLKKYISAGITTDHECFTREEALEKLSLGMMILIREGSAAKNFEALADLLHDYPDQMMFCSDDKHPDSLVKSHIDDLCRRSLKKGISIFNILKAACINPVIHYGLDIGTLQINDPADFIVTEDLENFKIVSTYINGICVTEKGKSNIRSVQESVINRFVPQTFVSADLACYPTHHLVNKKLPVIEALDGQLITNKLMVDAVIMEGLIECDTKNDILKLVVANRYKHAPVAKAFIKNFGFKRGAIASSVAHDSHNIIAVGVDDESLMAAITLVMDNRGGISCVDNSSQKILALPVAGLMSVQDGYELAAAYTDIDQMARSLGSTLGSPFMTLSFMALLVIPSLKLSDKGLFDGDSFSFI